MTETTPAGAAKVLTDARIVEIANHCLRVDGDSTYVGFARAIESELGRLASRAAEGEPTDERAKFEEWFKAVATGDGDIPIPTPRDRKMWDEYVQQHGLAWGAWQAALAAAPVAQGEPVAWVDPSVVRDLLRGIDGAVYLHVAGTKEIGEVPLYASPVADVLPVRDALTRLMPLIERAMKGYVFTADKAGEVVADMNTLRAAAARAALEGPEVPKPQPTNESKS